MAERNDVELRWLAVDAKAMNLDHKPQDDFEKKAVQALISGQEEYELAEDDVYRHVGVITLSSECLRCRMPGRTSNKSRAGRACYRDSDCEEIGIPCERRASISCLYCRFSLGLQVILARWPLVGDALNSSLVAPERRLLIASAQAPVNYWHI